MDMFKKAKAALGGNKSHSGGHAGGGAQKQDYGDKAINSIQAKMGWDKNHKYDKYEEKASDMVRGQFEKSSGKKVPSKFSN